MDTDNKRPISVTLIGCLYIVTGAIGFLYHAREFTAVNPFRFDVLGVETIRLLAILAGAYILRGHNWARWLAIAWIAFHVVLSAFHDLPQFAIHALFFALTAWLLLRPAAARYFRA
jgi:hypothetical protein